MKSVLKWGLVAFAVGLGAAVAYRMSAEAMAVVIGVACGVLASVLMSALMWAVMRGGRPQPEAELRRPDYPPVIVIQGGASVPGRLGAGDPYGYGADWGPEGFYLPGRASPRQYSIVGETEELPWE